MKFGAIPARHLGQAGQRGELKKMSGFLVLVLKQCRQIWRHPSLSFVEGKSVAYAPKKTPNMRNTQRVSELSKGSDFKRAQEMGGKC